MRTLRILPLLAAALALRAETVDAVRVLSKPLARTQVLPGELLPFQQVALFARVNGFVETVEVDRGSAVKKGQLLATLVAPELRAQRAEAEAKIRAAESQRAEAVAKQVGLESTLERLKAASATPGVIAGQEVVLAEKAVDAARAQVRALEGAIEAARSTAAALRDLESYLRVTAPFDGIITERRAHPGALAGPAAGPGGGSLLELEQISRLRLVVAVPESQIAGVGAGTRASFTVPAFPGEQFSGVVARIPRSMDPKNRTMAVELDVTNPAQRLAPGMYASVSLPLRRAASAILVPPTSVVTTTERTFVVRLKDGAAEWVPVSKGAPAGDLIEVYGPLQHGDLIVRRASDEMRAGTKLTAREAPPAKAN